MEAHAQLDGDPGIPTSPASPTSSSSGSEAAHSSHSTKSDPTSNASHVAAVAAAAVHDPIAYLQVKWDPHVPDKEYPTETALRRINVETVDCMRDPVEGIHLTLDESNITVMHALVVGPRETPYENGFFYFYIRIPSNYPWVPPQVKLMTTGNGKVRFNPNLYNSGKVCLSILGTWPGPSWTAALSVKSVLLSIQSIMNRTPFFNEPAYEGQEDSVIYQSMSEEYTDNIRFETMRVAVLGMIEAKTYHDSVNMPQVLREKMRTIFLENEQFYATVINDNLQAGKVNYKTLQGKLAKLVEKERAAAAAASSGASSSKSASTSNGTSTTSTKSKSKAGSSKSLTKKR